MLGSGDPSYGLWAGRCEESVRGSGLETQATGLRHDCQLHLALCVAQVVCLERASFVFFAQQLIADIALPRDKAELADRFADLTQREVVDRARFGDDILFDHQAPHVVRAEGERELPDLQSLGHPARLDVGDVVEIKPRDCLSLEVFE